MYPEQIAKKEAQLRAALVSMEPFDLERTRTSPEQGFRNRAKMVVTGTLEKPVIGLAGESQLDEGRELLNCPIHHPKLNALMAAMPAFITLAQLIPYQIQAQSGELKGLIEFYSPKSQQMYLRFVLRSKECVSRLKKHLSVLQNQFPELVCISANIQPIPHAILEGREEILLTPESTIVHRLGRTDGDLNLRLAPQAFVQTHFELSEQLYQTASDWIHEVRPNKLLELYCGQGAFSFSAARSAHEILGVELNPDAVKTANALADEQGLKHLHFIAADATSVERELDYFSPEMILANPPRRGLGESVVLIERAAPKNWIYSSCSIETMAADLKKLAHLYRLKRVQIFDLFPHTRHFETLAWLERH